MSKCPKCGAEAVEKSVTATYAIDLKTLEFRDYHLVDAEFACGTLLLDDGSTKQGDKWCRIRELTAENERLRKEVEDYRKGAAAEAAAGDEAREELANARDFIATSPTGQQRCYKCNQWIFSYPCMYCGR